MTRRPTTTLRSVSVQNFKAIHKSRSLRLGALNVFVGNNGSGKSSLLEALETVQILALDGLDAAMRRWHGIGHIRNKSRAARRADRGTEPILGPPLAFHLQGRVDGAHFSYSTAITDYNDGEQILIDEEAAAIGELSATRKGTSRLYLKRADRTRGTFRTVHPGESVLAELPVLKDYVQSWQFLRLNTQIMGEPAPRTLSRARIRLHPDGSNIAEFLHEFREHDRAAFEGLLEALKVVLPYARDLQPDLTDEVQRTIYLQMTEQRFKVPGWLLSTGTLRVLALLAVLRHPTPPPLVLIEEIENGLDPRTIHLIVDELHRAVERGQSQFILTTHSPYLMDLLPLSSIILCDRSDRGVTFRRPADDADVRAWSGQFTPGQLYTMGRLAERSTR